MFAQFARFIRRQPVAAQMALWPLYGIAVVGIWVPERLAQFILRTVGSALGWTTKGGWLAVPAKFAGVFLLLGALALQVGAFDLANLFFSLMAGAIMFIGFVIMVRAPFQTAPKKKKKR